MLSKVSFQIAEVNCGPTSKITIEGTLNSDTTHYRNTSAISEAVTVSETSSKTYLVNLSIITKHIVFPMLSASANLPTKSNVTICQGY